MFRKYTTSTLLALAGCCVLPAIASAQKFQGIEVEKRVGKATDTVFVANFTDPIVLNLSPQMRAIGNNDIERAIGLLSAKKPAGVNLYNQKSQLGSSAQTDYELSNQSIVIRSVIKNNVLSFKTTTPTALGSWADPQFTITYDLNLDAVIKLSPTLGPLTATASLSLSHVKVDSGNAPADLLKALSEVISFVGGPNFIQMAESALDNVKVSLSSNANQALAPLNKVLASLKSAGFKSMGAKVDSKTKRLQIIVAK